MRCYHFPSILPSKKEIDSLTDKETFIKYMTNIHFLQLLTDEASLVGVHFGEEEGGGYFTRDPFTTQVFYLIFFLIFDSSLDNHKLDRSILKSILKDRVLHNFSTIESYKKNIN